MGACGCGDFRGDLRFPGPGGDVYVIDLYHGCDYCGTPAGIVLHRFTPDEAVRWGVDQAETLDVTQDGVGVPVMDPEIMRRLMVKEAASEMKEAIDDVLNDVIRRGFRDASWKTQSEWAKARSRARAKRASTPGRTTT